MTDDLLTNKLMNKNINGWMRVIDVCSVKESGYEGERIEHRNREKIRRAYW